MRKGQRDETRQTYENDGATSIVLDESQTGETSLCYDPFAASFMIRS